MPAAPDSIRDEAPNWTRRHAQSLAYFASLQSFLTYSFGWTRHDKGLLWWLEHDRPTEDSRLALIDATWFHDGTLTGYAAWFAKRAASEPSGVIELLQRWLISPDLRPLQLSERWARRFGDALKREEWAGGSDPLHLWGGYHIAAPVQSPGLNGRARPSRARLVGADATTGSAIFISEVVEGWYAELAELGARLPPLPGNASWRIEVFVKPFGFLGSYRRSRLTGLWFTGRHRYHSIGN